MKNYFYMEEIWDILIFFGISRQKANKLIVIKILVNIIKSNTRIIMYLHFKWTRQCEDDTVCDVFRVHVRIVGVHVFSIHSRVVIEDFSLDEPRRNRLRKQQFENEN